MLASEIQTKEYAMNARSEITVPMDPLGYTINRYGYLPNSRWLQKERDRINKGPHKCKIVFDKITGKQSLYYIDGYFNDGVWVSTKREKK